MQTVITITSDPVGGSKVTVQVNDGQPVQVEHKPVSVQIPPTLAKRVAEPLAAPTAGFNGAPGMGYNPELCGYCKKRGEACKRHGGSDSQKYPKPAKAAAQPKPAADVPPLEAHDSKGTFLDPWDCGMCRNAGDLCTMHESMTNEGKRPPRGRGIE